MYHIVCYQLFNKKCMKLALTNVIADPRVRQCSGIHMPLTWKKWRVMSQLMGGSSGKAMCSHIDCWLRRSQQWYKIRNLWLGAMEHQPVVACSWLCLFEFPNISFIKNLHVT